MIQMHIVNVSVMLAKYSTNVIMLQRESSFEENSNKPLLPLNAILVVILLSGPKARLLTVLLVVIQVLKSDGCQGYCIWPHTIMQNGCLYHFNNPQYSRRP